MKLQTVVDNILNEATSTADQAKKMGLVYAGYGRWKDSTGKIVAKTINGQLVKIEDDGTGTEAPAAQAGAEGAPEGGEAAPDTSGELENPEQQATVSTHLERMLAAAGGDSTKLRKVLVKKHREGNASAQKWLQQLDSYDAAEKNNIQKSIADFDQKRQADMAAKKAKYSQLFPSPQI